MAMVDTRQTINGCRVWFEHSDGNKAKIEAMNYKSYLATIDTKRKKTTKENNNG